MKGGMIALLPADPDSLVIEGGEPAEELHLTLQFLCQDASEWGSTRRAQVIEAAEKIATDISGTIHARVVGHATFNPDGGPNGDIESCAVYLVGDNVDLGPLQRDLDATYAELLGADRHPQHVPWIPHVTGGYGLTAADLTYTGPVTFDRLVVALGEDWTEISLSSSLANAAREAYAHGWASSGGPLTDRVAAGCAAAVGLACEHADEPDILEVALVLGSLEGTWAAVYDRRERLYAYHTAAVSTAYRALLADLDPSAAITRVLRAAGIGEAVPVSDDQHAEIEAVAAAEAVRLLHQAAEHPSSPSYRATTAAITAALLDAEAEGVAGGVALVAQQAGAGEIDFDLAFADAHAELARSGSHDADATAVLGKVINGNATDLARAWTKTARDGGDFEDLKIDADDIIAGEEFHAVETLLDMAMGQEFSAGALALYTREGVSSVNFVTAGGPCKFCINAEAGNPWSMVEVPQPALHPHCRCSLQPTYGSVLSLGAGLARYLMAR